MITVTNYRGTNDMVRFSVDVTLANNRDVGLAEAGVIPKEKVRSTQIKGIVDTGAAMLVLPGKVAKELGLPETGSVKVRYADNRTGRRKRVSNVLLKLLGREAVFTAVVEPKRETALIGAIVMEELDLVADCTSQMVHPRDPKWIVAEIG
jgi:predicted aspartyl protease